MKYTDSYEKDLELLYSNNKGIVSLKNKSIFITGATGLIGSTIADYILFLNKTKSLNIKLFLGGRDYQKLCQRFYIYEENKDFCFVKYDSLKEIEIKLKFDFIIYSAGNAHPASISNNPVETILMNIQGLNNLLNYAKDNSTEMFLFISSSEIYGQTSGNDAHVEDVYGIINPLNTRACYPLSKKCAENLCLSYSQEYKLDTVIVRPGHIYGPQMTDKDSRATAQFIRNVIEGKDIVMKSKGEQLRSYCYSLDCASAILKILSDGEKNTAYNISNPDSICTIREFAEELANQTKHQIIFECPEEKESKSYNLMQNSSLNSSKLEALGWTPCFTLKHGVESTLKQLIY